MVWVGFLLFGALFKPFGFGKRGGWGGTGGLKIENGGKWTDVLFLFAAFREKWNADGSVANPPEFEVSE